jgi:hypothetical protein
MLLSFGTCTSWLHLWQRSFFSSLTSSPARKSIATSSFSKHGKFEPTLTIAGINDGVEAWRLENQHLNPKSIWGAELDMAVVADESRFAGARRRQIP